MYVRHCAWVLLRELHFVCGRQPQRQGPFRFRRPIYVCASLLYVHATCCCFVLGLVSGGFSGPQQAPAPALLLQQTVSLFNRTLPQVPHVCALCVVLRPALHATNIPCPPTASFALLGA